MARFRSLVRAASSLAIAAVLVAMAERVLGVGSPFFPGIVGLTAIALLVFLLRHCGPAGRADAHPQDLMLAAGLGAGCVIAAIGLTAGLGLQG